MERVVNVSVIVPIYNVAETLRGTLDSLVNQPMQDIEFVCVEDCSSDESKAILKEYARRDERFKNIYHETNLGTSQSRKDGVLASAGRYILFLDGDDELTADACECAYRAIEEAGTDMVQFDTEVINCGGMAEGRIQSNKRNLAPYLKRVESESLILACWKEHLFRFTLWNKIYNGEICRKAFEKVEDGRFPKAQDLYAFFLIAYYSRSYFGISDCLYRYHFGRGVTGGDLITLEKYASLLTEKKVADAIQRFVEGCEEKYSLKEIADTIENGFLAECVDRWKQNLMPEYCSEGFSYLTNVWTFRRVIDYLAKKDWYNRYNLSNKMLNVDYFHSRKRDEKKPLTIAAYYRSIYNGGAQRVVANLCNLWAELKDDKGNYRYKVVLITDELPKEDDYPLHPMVERATIPDRTVCIRDRYSERFDAWNELIDRYKIDIVVSSMWVDPCLLWDMMTVKGHPSKPAYLIHMHSFCCVPYRFNGGIGTEMMHNYQLCDGVVSLSECDRTFVSKFSEHTICIRNPLMFEPKDLPVSTYEKNTIVWVGRISNEKRPMDILYMMNKVVREIPDAKLYIVGDGDENLCNRLKELITALKLEKNVVMVGFSSQVQEYYQKANVYVSTSEYEGFSLTICEAMSYAVPVIAYEMPWLTVSQDGRGIVSVPHRRYDLMADKLIDLLSNPEKARCLGVQGKEQMCEMASVDIGHEWSTFFEGVFKDHSEIDLMAHDAILFRYLTAYQQVGRDYMVRDKNKLNQNLQAANTKINELNLQNKKLKREKEALRREREKLKTEKANIENSRTYRLACIFRKLFSKPMKLYRALRGR